MIRNMLGGKPPPRQAHTLTFINPRCVRVSAGKSKAVMETKTYPLEVEEELWEKWKDTIPRSKNLDDALRELIEEDLERKGHDDV